MPAVYDWETDNRSQSSTPPTLTYTCTKVSDGDPCANARVDTNYPEARLYDNNGVTYWRLVSDNMNTKWAITETYLTPVTVKTVISRMFYCTTTR